ncbi:MAG: hypothetical protein FWD14_03325 [Treponema sp.]|nr:hypothetical protein [Treponema sp.]
MKTIIKILLAAALCTLLLACKSGGKYKEEPFTVDLTLRQIEIGEIELQFDTFLSLGGLTKEAIKVTYIPREDAVVLQFRQSFVTYNQCWSRAGRQSFIHALQKYNEDYDARNLNRNVGRRARQKYGVVEGFLLWMPFAFSIRAQANMDVQLGYAFKDRAPYFTINQKEAEHVDPNTRDNNRTSPNITMYFTRAQAAELAALFDPYFLSTLLSPNIDLDDIGNRREAARDDYY